MDGMEAYKEYTKAWTDAGLSGKEILTNWENGKRDLPEEYVKRKEEEEALKGMLLFLCFVFSIILSRYLV